MSSWAVRKFESGLGQGNKVESCAIVWNSFCDEEGNIKSILSQYNINVVNIKNQCDKGKKAVWWIKSTSGDKILKKHSCSSKTLEFILSAVEHLRNGDVNLPKIIKI